MNLPAQISIGVVIVIHLYIVWLEMFAWTTRGRKVFKNFPPDLFEKTKVLAGNQGLYNGFLAAGLIWGLLENESHLQLHISLFFLACVMVAGVYGAITADKKIFFVQTLPALIAVILLHI